MLKQIKDLGHTSALLSAFLSKSRMNLADLTGQRPCPLECLFLACAVLPTPPQKRLNGMACLWARTSSKYLLAFAKGNFLMAKAVSLVFCKYNSKGKFSGLATIFITWPNNNGDPCYYTQKHIRLLSFWVKINSFFLPVLHYKRNN